MTIPFRLTVDKRHACGVARFAKGLTVRYAVCEWYRAHRRSNQVST